MDKPFSGYTQELNPLLNTTVFGFDVPWSAVLSTFFAALPVLVLFWLLVPRRWLASKAGAAGAAVAIVIAVVVYGMPADMAVRALASGAASGPLPAGLSIFLRQALLHLSLESRY